MSTDHSHLTVNLRIDASTESLNQLCDKLARAVKPDGGYEAATTDDPSPGTGCDQLVQVQWWIPQHGCDSLENTLDAIKGRLLVAVRDWWATALIPATPAAPAPEIEAVKTSVVGIRDALERLVELDDTASVLGADPDMTTWNNAIAAARAALKAEPMG